MAAEEENSKYEEDFLMAVGCYHIAQLPNVPNYGQHLKEFLQTKCVDINCLIVLFFFSIFLFIYLLVSSDKNVLIHT